LIAAFGHVWQPFGGSGYFVLLALLGLVLLLSSGLILLPIWIENKRRFSVTITAKIPKAAVSAGWGY
jgi:hypothetical protein